MNQNKLISLERDYTPAKASFNAPIDIVFTIIKIFIEDFSLKETVKLLYILKNKSIYYELLNIKINSYYKKILNENKLYQARYIDIQFLRESKYYIEIDINKIKSNEFIELLLNNRDLLLKLLYYKNDSFCYKILFHLNESDNRIDFTNKIEKNKNFFEKLKFNTKSYAIILNFFYRENDSSIYYNRFIL